jgi:hypothetical protein
VQRGPSFAQLLDEKLHETIGKDRIRSASTAAHAFAPAHPLLFSLAYQFAPASRDFRALSPVGEDRNRRYASTAGKRALTADQRLALDALNRCGADLTADFTAEELRSAYRALARSFHPDRHTTNTHVDQTRLARLFGEISKHHKTLLCASR